MNFYDFLKQKYEDFNSECESCPCKILRNKILGGMRRRICLEEIIYLANKYNVCNDDKILSRQECIFISLRIAKKIFEKKFNKI